MNEVGQAKETIMTEEEVKNLIKRRDTLLAMVADSYRRMATNSSPIYRGEQLAKCYQWLEELTEINSTSPILFNLGTVP